MATDARLSQEATQALTSSAPTGPVRLSQEASQVLASSAPTGPTRLSQLAVQTLITPTVITDSRLSQLATQVLISGPSSEGEPTPVDTTTLVQLTQIATEALGGPSECDVQVTQVATEAMGNWEPNPEFQLTQTLTGALGDFYVDPEFRLTQLRLQILIKNGPETPVIPLRKWKLYRFDVKYRLEGTA